MTFEHGRLNVNTVQELQKPLDRIHVKSRTQSGRALSYLESWHVIDEANHIFGFDGWTRETVECQCVSERERKIGKEPNQRDGYGVTYTAKVRVTVHGITREGSGAGHGIDVDLGQAHESALKEAESDAMKRAFMTFGYRFGLALYDKAQRNVVSASKRPNPAHPAAKARQNGNGQKVAPKGTDEAIRQWADGFIRSVKDCRDRKEVQAGLDKVGAKLDVLKEKKPAIHAEVMNAVEYAMENLPDEAPEPTIAAE